MKSNSGDRTTSPRKRAGSRRNKRLRNVGSFATDYPADWTRFYQCDGSFDSAVPLIRWSVHVIGAAAERGSKRDSK